MENRIFPNEGTRYRAGAAVGLIGGLAVGGSVIVPQIQESGLNFEIGVGALAFGCLSVLTSALGAVIGDCIRRKQ